MIEEELFKLNEIELFLKRFLNDYPQYQLDVVGEKAGSDANMDRMISVLKNSWKTQMGNKKFFLEDDASYIKEDDFLGSEENVTMKKNLRYMPLLMHSHQFIEINYVYSSFGSCIITKDGRHELENGDIILSPPNFVHCFDVRNDNGVILDFFIRVTTFDTVFSQLLHHKDYLATVFTNAIYNSEGSFILWHCKEDSVIKKIIMESYDEWIEKPKYNEQMLEANIIKFFILLMRNHENEAVFSHPQVNSTDTLFQSLHNYMNIHCKTVTLSILAAQFGYSERQIIRILKKESGKGFSALLQDIRMNKAIQLLKKQEASIPQISDALGFSSVSYFQKVFIKTFSFSPEAFKKRYSQQMH